MTSSVADEGREILQALGRAPVRIVASQALVEAALEIATASSQDRLRRPVRRAGGGQRVRLVTADDRLAKALAGGPLALNVRSLRGVRLTRRDYGR